MLTYRTTFRNFLTTNFHSIVNFSISLRSLLRNCKSKYKLWHSCLKIDKIFPVRKVYVYPVFCLKCIEIVKTVKTDYTKIWHTRIRRGQQKFRVEKSIAWRAARVFPELVKKMSTTKLSSTRWKLKIWIFKYPHFVRASWIRFFFFLQYLFHTSTR